MAEHEPQAVGALPRRLTYPIWELALLGAILDLILIAFLLLSFPYALSGAPKGVLSVVEPAALLLACGLLSSDAGQWTQHAEPAAVKPALWCALAVCALYVVEAALHSAPVAPSTWGLYPREGIGPEAYPVLFALYVAAGVVGGRATGRVRSGVVAALWAGVLGALVALGASLLTTAIYAYLAKGMGWPWGQGEPEDVHRWLPLAVQYALGDGFLHRSCLAGVAALWGSLGGVFGVWLSKRAR